MKEFDVFYRRILPRVKGVAMPMVDEAIRQAGIEFCERTRLWRDEDQFTASDALDYEPMVAPYGAVIFEIETARFNGELLEVATRDWLDDHVPRWREQQASQAKWVTQSQPDTIRLVPAAQGTVALELFLKPANDAEMFPDFMVDHYARVITDGALAELYATPGDFQNPGLAQFHSQRFNARLDELFDSHATGQQSAPVRVKAQFQ